MMYSAMYRACKAPWGLYTRTCMTVLTLLRRFITTDHSWCNTCWRPSWL